MPMTGPELKETPPLPRTSVTSSLRIDPDVYSRARTAAWKASVSLNQWVVQAIEAQLAREEQRGG